MMRHHRHCGGRRAGGAEGRTWDAHQWMGWSLPPGLYRDPQHGKVAGVCAGLGAYFQVKPKFLRLAAILGCVFGLFIPIILAYALLVFILPTEPADPRWQGDEAFAGNREAAPPSAGDLKARFQQLDQRLVRMEEWVTSEDYRLRQKFRDL